MSEVSLPGNPNIVLPFLVCLRPRFVSLFPRSLPLSLLRFYLPSVVSAGLSVLLPTFLSACPFVCKFVHFGSHSQTVSLYLLVLTSSQVAWNLMVSGASRGLRADRSAPSTHGSVPSTTPTRIPDASTATFCRSFRFLWCPRCRFLPSSEQILCLRVPLVMQKRKRKCTSKWCVVVGVG